MLLLCLSVLLLLSQAAAFYQVKLPPQESLQVANGSQATILHRSWFNASESAWFLYAGFDLTFHQVSGVFLGGNLEIEYSQSCDDSICGAFGESVGSQQVPTYTTSLRCESVLVTVHGSQEVNGGMVKFYLFRGDGFFQSEVIGRVLINVTTDTYVSNNTTSDRLSSSTTTTAPSTTSEPTSTSTEDSDTDTDVCSDSSAVYVLLSLFLVVMMVNFATVGFLTVWTIRLQRHCHESSIQDDDMCQLNTQMKSSNNDMSQPASPSLIPRL